MPLSSAAEAYDKIPYPYLTYSQTHPDRLASLATLLGLEVPAIDRCRILDIGCAAGGNIFPMAYGLPGSEFVGIDFSAVQIKAGQEVVQKLGLKNVTLKHADLMDIPDDIGSFDYIIAHGFYSWVPEPVRDKLLDVCRRHLSPNGIAYISYNTYPGWHMLRMARDAMLYHGRKESDPQLQAQKANEMFRFLAQSVSPEDNAYGAFLHDYGKALEEKLAKSPVGDFSLMLHDELSEINEPIYFYQFIEHASKHGLQYLVEAEFSHVMPNKFHPEVTKELREMAKGVIDTEQYIDFLLNRTFRMTLLVHAERKVNRILRPQSVTGLRMASYARPVSETPELHSNKVEKFKGGDDAIFSTNHPLSKAAMVYLHKISPRAVPFGQLVTEAVKTLEPDTELDMAEETIALAANILKAYGYSGSLMRLHMMEPDFVTDLSERPVASPVARWQAVDSTYITNLWHERVELEDMSRFILRHLDGQNNYDDILEKILAMYKEGTFKVKFKKKVTKKQAPKIIAGDLEKRIKAIAEAALLIA